MRCSWPCSIVAALAVWCAPRPANSQNVVATVREQRFFFRAVLGLGYGVFSASGGSVKVSGGGGLGNFAVGVNVVPTVALHVDACAMGLLNPAVSGSRAPVGADEPADSTTTTSILGGGVTWSHPSGLLWASLSGGVAILAVEIPARAGTTVSSYGRTALGWGLNLLAGHDWPTAYHWRVGVALHAIFSTMADQPDATGAYAIWTNFGGGLSLTVTDR